MAYSENVSTSCIKPPSFVFDACVHHDLLTGYDNAKVVSTIWKCLICGFVSLLSQISICVCVCVCVCVCMCACMRVYVDGVGGYLTSRSILQCGYYSSYSDVPMDFV